MKTKTAVQVGSVSTTIEQIGAELNDIAKQKDALKKKMEPTVKKLDAFEDKEKELRVQMADALVGIGRNSTYIGGFQFSLKHDTAFEIINEPMALEWAAAHDCLRFDRVKANTLLRREVMVPDGFSRVEKRSVARSADKKAQ